MKKNQGTLLAKVSILTYGLMLAHAIWAQTFTTLHNFTPGSAGSSPYGGLILYSNTLYGTVYFEALNSGSAAVHGTVFAISTDGTAFTTLHNFPEFNEQAPTNIDGNGLFAGLTLSGGRLYGTTVLGGSLGNGTVFAINTDGTDFTVLHDFNRSNDGAEPHARLVLSGNTLYGTAAYGGTSNAGTVFALSTNGSGFTVLHTFTGHSDGGLPYSTLLLSGGTLYGTAISGGVDLGSGTVFALNLAGTAFKVLHSFTIPRLSGVSFATNSDGANPRAGLIRSGNMLYGVAAGGGSGGRGTVYALNTDGTGFRVLHNFAAIPRPSPVGGASLPATNSDGSLPNGELILCHNTLYGAAYGGGNSGHGTLFSINTDGTSFTVLHTFNASSDGSGPNGSLTLSGNTLYGTALFGGSAADGTVFSISFSPQPTITPSGSNVLLSWPTNYAGFDYSAYALHSTTNLASGIWTSNFSPVVINGRKTVTNSISGTQQFFRLSQ